MNDHLRERIAVIDPEQPFCLGRIVVPDSCFDRNADVRVLLLKQGEGFVEKAVQRIRIFQKTRTLLPVHHLRSRTAQIQISLLIPPLFEIADRPDKLVRPVRHDLRHKRDSLIMLRRDLCLLPALKGQVLICGKKWRIVSRGAAEKGMMELSEIPGGQPLHRGKFIQHDRILPEAGTNVPT